MLPRGADGNGASEERKEGGTDLRLVARAHELEHPEEHHRMALSPDPLLDVHRSASSG